MIRRATLDDVPEIAELLNDPAIRPLVGGEGYLDPTGLIDDRRNVCLFDSRGGALFAWRGPGVFEVHLFYRIRGREALEAFREAVETMQAAGARMIWGPSTRREVSMFGRMAGFKSHGNMTTPQGERELMVLES